MPGPEKRDNGVSYTIYTTFSFSDINVNLLLQFLVKLYRDLDADDRIELLKLLHLHHFSTSWQYEIEFGNSKLKVENFCNTSQEFSEEILILLNSTLTI